MIQLGQLSPFVMAQLAFKLPFQSTYVPPSRTCSWREKRKKAKGDSTSEAVKKKEQDNNKHIIDLDTVMLAIIEINVTFVPDQLCLLEDPRCEIREILEAYWVDWQDGDSPATHERMSFISNKAARRQ